MCRLLLVAVSSHYPCKREPDTTRDEPRVSSLIVGASCIRDTHKTPRRTPPCALAGFVILSTAWVRFDERRGQNPNSRSCWIAGVSFGTWIAMQLLMR